MKTKTLLEKKHLNLLLYLLNLELIKKLVWKNIVKLDPTKLVEVGSNYSQLDFHQCEDFLIIGAGSGDIKTARGWSQA